VVVVFNWTANGFLSGGKETTKNITHETTHITQKT
jgi:hypothetical protein